MKKRVLLFIIFPMVFFSQEKEKKATFIDAQFFHGNIIKHADYVGHLITAHPDGMLLSYNWKTYGNKEWQQRYNYPDYGVSYQYIDFKNRYLGVNHAVGIHYNFYLFKRNLLFRVSQGIALTSNPYNKETNNKNNAFGTKLLDNNYFLLQYQKQNIVEMLVYKWVLFLPIFQTDALNRPILV